MTKLLEEGIEAVRALPEEGQDLAGEVLLAIAEQSKGIYRLSDDERAAIEDSRARGLASDEEVAALFARFRK